MWSDLGIVRMCARAQMIWFVRWQLHQVITYTRWRAILLNLVKLMSKIIICGARAQCAQMIKNMRTIPRSLLMRDSWNDVESRLNPLHDGVAIMQWSRLKSIVIGDVHGKAVWHMALTCMGGDTSGGGGNTSCMLRISLELCGFGGRGGGGPYSGRLFVKSLSPSA